MTEAQTRPESTAKVFFAIWPDAAAQKKLSELAAQLADICGGKQIRSPMMHLTLVFVGNVDNHWLESLRKIANEIRHFSFDLTINEIQYWQHKRIIHAGPSQCPAKLLSLVADLQDRLSQAGFSLEKRRYLPHITLVRKAMCPTLPDLTTSITWHVNEWSLVQSKQTDQGSIYVPLDCWSLE